MQRTPDRCCIYHPLRSVLHVRRQWHLSARLQWKLYTQPTKYSYYYFWFSLHYRPECSTVLVSSLLFTVQLSCQFRHHYLPSRCVIQLQFDLSYLLPGIPLKSHLVSIIYRPEYHVVTSRLHYLPSRISCSNFLSPLFTVQNIM